MNKFLLSLVMSGLFLAGSTQTIARTVPYYAFGEDIENILNGDEASIITQLEDKLLAFPVVRELHGYFFNVEYLSNSKTEGYDDDEYVSGSDDEGGC